MTKKHSLAVILKDYPYKKGEVFFQSELIALSSSFKEVYLFSRHLIKSEESLHFGIPSNVQLVNLCSTQTVKSKLIAVIQTLTTGKWRDVIRDLKTNGLSIEWKKLKIILAYEDERIRMFESLQITCKKLERPLNSFIWYSYWCDESAYLLARLRQTGHIDFAICRTHNFDIYTERHPYGYLPYRRFIVEHLNEILCISSHGQCYLQTRYPDFKEKFTLQRLGVENQSISLLKTLNPLVIITISNIHPVKNLEAVIEALEKWTSQTIEWHHFGDGNDSDYVAKIERQTFECLSKNPKVKCKFWGFVAPEFVLDQIRQLNPTVLVNSSHFEGIPVSMMEACSLGIPVIGPLIYGVPEIVKDGVNGFTFYPVNADSLRQAIAKMTGLTESTYAEMRLNARAIQQAEFNAERNHLKFASHVRQISNESSANC